MHMCYQYSLLLYAYVSIIFITIQNWDNLLTLSAHAREGYSSHFVCHSLTHSLTHSLFHSGEGAVSGLKLTSVYVLGDDLSALNVTLF